MNTKQVKQLIKAIKMPTKRRGRRINKRRKYNKYMPIYRQLTDREQSFGYGTFKFVATVGYAINCSTRQLISVSNVLDASGEFERIEQLYKYFRILGIALVFNQRNLPISSNQDKLSVLMNYDGNPTPYSKEADNVRTVQPYSTRTKVLKYRMPRLAYNGVILNEWVNQSDIMILGNAVVAQFISTDNTNPWHFKFEIIILCKGPKLIEEVKTLKNEDLDKKLNNKLVQEQEKQDQPGEEQEKKEKEQHSEEEGIEEEEYDDEDWFESE